MSMYKPPRGLRTAAALDLDARLRAATSATSESLSSVAAQIDSLQRAYNTLSHIFVEEIDGVRSECSVLRSQLSGRIREIDTLTDAQKSQKTHSQSLENELGFLRRHMKKFKHELKHIDENNNKQHNDLEQSFKPIWQDLQSRLSVVESEKQSLWEQMTSQATLIDTLSQENKQLKDQIREITAKMSKLHTSQEKMINDTSQFTSRTDSRWTALDHRILSLSDDVTSIARDSTQNFERIDVLIEKISSRENNTEEKLHDHTLTTKKRIDEVSQNIDTFITDQLRSVDSSLANLRNELDRVQRRAQTSLQDYSQTVRRNISRLEVSQANYETHVAAIDSTVTTKMNEIQQQVVLLASAITSCADAVHVPVSPSVSRLRFRSASPTSPLRSVRASNLNEPTTNLSTRFTFRNQSRNARVNGSPDQTLTASLYRASPHSDTQAIHDRKISSSSPLHSRSMQLDTNNQFRASNSPSRKSATHQHSLSPHNQMKLSTSVRTNKPYERSTSPYDVALDTISTKITGRPSPRRMHPDSLEKTKPDRISPRVRRTSPVHLRSSSPISTSSAQERENIATSTRFDEDESLTLEALAGDHRT